MSLPGIPGLEAAGVIEAVGPGVEEFCPGERVAYSPTAMAAMPVTD